MNQVLDMSPDASPGTPTGKSGVRRVNNLPIYIICGLMAAFLLIMALVAADRTEKQKRPPDVKDANATSTSMFASELAGQQKDGIVPAAKSAPLTAPDVPIDSPPITTVRPDTLEAPPAPPTAATPAAQQQEQDPRARIAMEKMHMLEEAIKARTNVQATAPRSSGSAPATMPKTGGPLSREEAITRIAAAQQQIDMQNADDPTAMFQARLQQLQQAGMMGTANSATAATDLPPTAPGTLSAAAPGKTYGQFDGSAQQDRWRLDSQVQAPRSPYELRAGFVLPAILISGINSDLPGQVIGQVSQDVFDTATGKWTVIPQGSRLVGQYSSDIAYGQARVLIAWQRIIFPDGKALDIGAMPGADSAGYAGFHDKVNNHYLRLFGSALLMSGVTAGIALSQPESLYGSRQTARSALSEALGQQLGHVTAQMIARNMGISPTLEIRPGYRFNVVVTKDLTFSKPYKAFDY
jgi:type IV secretory pathway VirB10-like protein